MARGLSSMNVTDVEQLFINMELINIATIIINLLILTLNIKLYTEYFKDKSMDKRKSPK